MQLPNTMMNRNFMFHRSPLPFLLSLVLSSLAASLSAANSIHSHRSSKHILLAANAKANARSTRSNQMNPAPSKTSAPLAPSHVTSAQQCVGVPLTVCVGSKESSSIKLYAPNAKEKSLTSWYTFDDGLGYDQVNTLYFFD